MSTVSLPGIDKPTSIVAIVDGTTGELGTIPPDLLTDGGDGPNRRLRVDVAQTSFFAGREFRVFKELNIAAPTNTTHVIKVVVPVNVILAGLEVVIDNGFVKVESVTGGTEGGSFTAMTVFPRNTMTERPFPYYTNQVTISEGGTHTGGTILDIIRLKVENASGAASSVGASQGDERGVAAGTYYFRLINMASTGATEGVFKARWEERV